MCVGGGRKWNSLLNGEPNDLVARIKLVHRFAPAGSGKLDGQIALANEIECFASDRFDLRAWPMAVDLDEIKMGETIDESRRSNLAHATKVICINVVDVAILELRRAGRHAIEHLIVALKVVHRAEHEIETLPIFLHPLAARRGSFRIVIERDAGTDFHVRIFPAQLVDLIEIDAGVMTIVIGKSDIADPTLTRRIIPRLQEFLRIRLHPMPLRMHVVIGEESHRRHGSVRNFWRIRRSGYLGKKTSTMKALFGVRSRVEMVSLYSTCSPGLIRTRLGFSLTA